MTVALDESLRTHLRILASAGSGKTYQLTARYLQLLFAGVPVSSILASTFTRAAAGEIRDRVLSRMAKATIDEGVRQELAESIDREHLSQAETVALLRELCDNIHRMQIRTLDSFFGSIVHSFAIELGIPPGIRVADEYQEQALRQESIRILLESHDSAQLILLLRLLTQGASDRAIIGAIDRVVADLYELARESDGAAWQRIEPREELSPAEIEAAVERLAGAPAPAANLSREAFENDLEQARDQNWDAFLQKGLADKIAQGATTYRRGRIDPALLAAYEPLIRHAGAVLVNRVREENRAARDLLERFDTILGEIKRRRRIMTFSDVTFAMLRAQQGESFDEICFRIDASIRHLLLDEFQDTSISQWRALEPIIRELVSGGDEPRSVFCVGDVKQSIYGWRDASPEILDDLPEHLCWPDGSSPIRTESLARSYRSAPVVMETVNTVFHAVASSSVLEGFREAAERFSRGFAPHATARNDLEGHVQLRTAPQSDENARQEHTRLEFAADLIASLHDQRPSISIGALTRTNRAAVRLLWELRRSRRRVPASARGGGPLTDSPAVNVVLDALRLADHPDDTVAAFNVAESPLGEILDLHDARSSLRRRSVAGRLRRRALEVGYAATIAEWMPRLMASCDRRESRRLLQLIEQAGRYDANATLRSDDFVRTIELRSVSEIQPAPVQVMTIHQAKGLEFDAVILTDLEESLVGRPPPGAFLRQGGIGEITHVCRWIRNSVRQFIPELEETFEHCRLRAVRESLCLLYVGMTRARQSLIMIIDPSSANEKQPPQRPSSILRETLAGTDRVGPEQILFDRGTPAWRTEQEVKRAVVIPAEAAGSDRLMDPREGKERTEAAEQIRIRLAPARGAARRGATAKSASAIEGGAVLRQRLRLDDADALERGTVLHGLFEEVEWLDNGIQLPDESVVSAEVHRRAPRRDEGWVKEIARRYLRACSHPEVRRALSRAAWSGDEVRLWRERPFVRRVEGKLQRGAIDRLVVQFDDQGKAKRAQVMDFKSDEMTAPEAPWRAEAYRAQMESYRSAVAEMFDLPPREVSLMLLFVVPGVVVELGEESERQGGLFGE